MSRQRTLGKVAQGTSLGAGPLTGRAYNVIQGLAASAPKSANLVQLREGQEAKFENGYSRSMVVGTRGVAALQRPAYDSRTVSTTANFDATGTSINKFTRPSIYSERIPLETYLSRFFPNQTRTADIIAYLRRNPELDAKVSLPEDNGQIVAASRRWPGPFNAANYSATQEYLNHLTSGPVVWVKSPALTDRRNDRAGSSRANAAGNVGQAQRTYSNSGATCKISSSKITAPLRRSAALAGQTDTTLLNKILTLAALLGYFEQLPLPLQGGTTQAFVSALGPNGEDMQFNSQQRRDMAKMLSWYHQHSITDREADRGHLGHGVYLTRAAANGGEFLNMKDHGQRIDDALTGDVEVRGYRYPRAVDPVTGKTRAVRVGSTKRPLLADGTPSDRGSCAGISAGADIMSTSRVLGRQHRRQQDLTTGQVRDRSVRCNNRAVTELNPNKRNYKNALANAMETARRTPGAMEYYNAYHEDDFGANQARGQGLFDGMERGNTRAENTAAFRANAANRQAQRAQANIDAFTRKLPAAAAGAAGAAGGAGGGARGPTRRGTRIR